CLRASSSVFSCRCEDGSLRALSSWSSQTDCRALMLTSSLRKLRVLCVFVVIFTAASLPTKAQRTQRLPVVTVLDLGATPVAKLAAETLRGRFRSSGELVVADADL